MTSVNANADDDFNDLGMEIVARNTPPHVLEGEGLGDEDVNVTELPFGNGNDAAQEHRSSNHASSNCKRNTMIGLSVLVAVLFVCAAGFGTATVTRNNMMVVRSFNASKSSKAPKSTKAQNGNGTTTTTPTKKPQPVRRLVPTSTPGRLLSWLGMMSSDEVEDEEDDEELIELVEKVVFELEGEDVVTNCDVPEPEQSDIPATWQYYNELIKKNRKIASLARNVREYAPKRGLVEDIIEQQDAEDEDSENGKDVSVKDVDQRFIPHHLVFTHRDNLLDCDVSSSEPSLHTMAHNVRDTIEAYRQVWGDDMEYNFLTDVECRKAIYEAEPELLAFYDDLEGMFKGDICRSAFLYLKGG